MQLSKLSRSAVLENERRFGGFKYKELPCTCVEFRQLIANWETNWKPKNQQQNYYTWERTLLDRLHWEIRFSDGKLYEINEVSRLDGTWWSVELVTIYEFHFCAGEHSCLQPGCFQLGCFQTTDARIFPSLAAAKEFLMEPVGTPIKKVEFAEIKSGMLWGKPCYYISQIDLWFEDGGGFRGGETIFINEVFA